MDVLDKITNSVKNCDPIDHIMANESLIDSYFRGDIYDVENRIKQEFRRKFIKFKPIECHIDFDFV